MSIEKYCRAYKYDTVYTAKYSLQTSKLFLIHVHVLTFIILYVLLLFKENDI